MVRLSQNVNAYYEGETARGTEVGSALKFLGLLDTFDARNIDMQYAPVPSIGQSTDPKIVKGPEMVKLSMKFGLWGTGWRDMLGWGIGRNPDQYDANKLESTTPKSFTVLAEEVDGLNYNCSLVNGVTADTLSLEADYTTGGPMTLDLGCHALYTVESNAPGTSRTNARNFAVGFIAANYSTISLPSAPATAPLTANNLTVERSNLLERYGILITSSEAGSYVEVGEEYMRFYTANGSLDASVGTSGRIDITTGNASTIGDGTTSGADGGVAYIIDQDANWTCSDIAGSSALLTKNLRKGIYKASSQNIYVAEGLAEVPYLKTVKLTVANNQQVIPEKVTGADSAIKTLQNANISSGKADVTLDLTMTAKDESSFYDDMYADDLIPLMRLSIDDNGTTRTIGLTNGTIMTRTAPYSAGGEVVETVSIKFTGAGNHGNFSAFAISGDIAPT